MNTFKWGIVGTGGISSRFISAINSVENAQVYAVVSRKESTAKNFATKHQISNYYCNYMQLVEDPNIDIIYIATPTFTHYEYIKLALIHKKHVLCEKAITSHFGELLELQQLALDNNCFLMEGLWSKCLPTYRKAKKWIDEDIIGQIEFIDVQLSNIFYKESFSHRFSQNSGGGALLDSGVYAIALVLDFMGNEPCDIMSISHCNEKIELDSYITLKYQKNTFAHIITGFSTQNNCSATIVGSKGIIEFPTNFHFNSNINLYDKEHRLIEKITLPFKCNGLEYEILEVQNCISNNLLESKIISLSSSLATLKVIETVKSQLNF